MTFIFHFIFEEALAHSFSFYLTTFLSNYLPICLSVCLPACLSVCLSVCLSIYLSINCKLALFLYRQSLLLVPIYMHMFIYNLVSCFETSRKNKKEENLKELTLLCLLLRFTWLQTFARVWHVLLAFFLLIYW